VSGGERDPRGPDRGGHRRKARAAVIAPRGRYILPREKGAAKLSVPRRGLHPHFRPVALRALSSRGRGLSAWCPRTRRLKGGDLMPGRRCRQSLSGQLGGQDALEGLSACFIHGQFWHLGEGQTTCLPSPFELLFFLGIAPDLFTRIGPPMRPVHVPGHAFSTPWAAPLPQHCGVVSRAWRAAGVGREPAMTSSR